MEAQKQTKASMVQEVTTKKFLKYAGKCYPIFLMQWFRTVSAEETIYLVSYFSP